MKRDWDGLGKGTGKGKGKGKGSGGKTEEEVERDQVRELKRQAKEREEKRWREGKEEHLKRDRDQEGATGPWSDAEGTASGTNATEGTNPTGEDTYSDDLDEMRQAHP